MRRFGPVGMVAAVLAALVPVGVLASGPGWAIQPTPNLLDGITDSELYGVSCTSATACTAVGNYDNQGLPFVERWNGTSWIIQATPNPSGATSSKLFAVSCTAVTTCTAVGDYTNDGRTYLSLVERWNGSTWSAQPTPNPSHSIFSALDGVSCTSAMACTAIGVYTNSGGTSLSLAERWNGSSWAIQTTPNPSGATHTYLNGVSCTSTTACTAVGYYTNSGFADLSLAERWDGSSWAIQATPGPSGATHTYLNGVSCTSATACTAAGYYINSGSANLTLAEGWNGSSWSAQATPNPGGVQGSFLNGVSCTSATACTAVGDYLNSGSTAMSMAERWNGSTWSAQATPNPSVASFAALRGVFCTSATACTAVGFYTKAAGNNVTLAEDWNGWVIQATPNPTGATQSYLKGVSCTSTAACTAVGTYTNSAATNVTLAERWNGSGWAIQATSNPSGATSSFLFGVSCTAATACTAVGYYTNSAGTTVTLAERWNGTGWAIQATPNPGGATASVLQGVSCTSATACTAVGYYTNSGGTRVTLAERWNGTSWVIQATPNPSGAQASYLMGVSCTSATACAAAGYDTNSSGADVTLAERWNGTSWATQVTPSPGTPLSVLWGVSCTSATACTAVGYYSPSPATYVALAERWNGTSWAIQATPNPSGAQSSYLRGVSCASATACTAVGNYTNSGGTNVTLAEGWNGSGWAIQATLNPSGAQASYLLAVSCPSATACTATGYYINSSGAYLTLVEG